jgi:hypothetical protein
MPVFNHHVLELTDVSSPRRSDGVGLASMVVAAAGAGGMFALGSAGAGWPRGIAVGMLCRDGHIVLTARRRRICFVDIVARAPADVSGVSR